MSAPLLTVENLRTGFDTGEGFLRAVDGIDFEIDAGRHARRSSASRAAASR